MSIFKSDLQKYRIRGIAWLLAMMASFVVLYRYTQNIMRLIEHGQWKPPALVDTLVLNEAGVQQVVQVPKFTDVADLGVEILQPAFVAMIYVVLGAVFSTLIAYVMEKQLRETSFGTWSRFAITWALAFLAYTWLSASIL